MIKKLIIGFLCFLGIYCVEKKVYISKNTKEWSEYEKEAVLYINSLRGDRHYLVQDDNLYKYAKERAVEIAKDGVSHDGFKRVNDILSKEGLVIGENIAYAYDTPYDLIFAWSRSVIHNRIMINPSYKYIGLVSVMEGKEKYICMLIGK